MVGVVMVLVVSVMAVVEVVAVASVAFWGTHLPNAREVVGLSCPKFSRFLKT